MQYHHEKQCFLSFSTLFIVDKLVKKTSYFLSRYSIFFKAVTTTYIMSQVIDQDETHTYEILQEKDCIECASLLAHTFTKHNPYEWYMKTTYEQFYPDTLLLLKTIFNTNLAVIARHKETNEIHGIVQGVDVKTFDAGKFFTTTADDDKKSADPIIELMHQSEQRYMEDYEKKYGELKENSVIHIFMAGVRPDCLGQGEFFEKIFFKTHIFTDYPQFVGKSKTSSLSSILSLSEIRVNSKRKFFSLEDMRRMQLFFDKTSR